MYFWASDMVQDGIYGFPYLLYFTIPSDIAKVTGNSTDGLRLIPLKRLYQFTDRNSNNMGKPIQCYL